MRVRVVGAGVSGLTAAAVLAEAGHRVAVGARASSPYTTSDVAAAFWHPYRARPSDPVARWARASYAAFGELAGDSASGVTLVPVRQLFRAPVADPWWGPAVPGLRRLAAADLLPGFADGFALMAPVIDTRRYLPYLAARCAGAGVAFERASFESLEEAARGFEAVVDCAGLGARELAGDGELYPLRGEVVRLANPGLAEVLVDELAPGGPTYAVPRGDDVVLGSTAVAGSFELAPDFAAQRSIVERAAHLDPRLATARRLGSAVGLRPTRERGVRLELELTAYGPVVHDYGHAGAGVTLSWGCGGDVAALVAAA